MISKTLSFVVIKHLNPTLKDFPDEVEFSLVFNEDATKRYALYAVINDAEYGITFSANEYVDGNAKKLTLTQWGLYGNRSCKHEYGLRGCTAPICSYEHHSCDPDIVNEDKVMKLYNGVAKLARNEICAAWLHGTEYKCTIDDVKNYYIRGNKQRTQLSSPPQQRVQHSYLSSPGTQTLAPRAVPMTIKSVWKQPQEHSVVQEAKPRREETMEEQMKKIASMSQQSTKILAKMITTETEDDEQPSFIMKSLMTMIVHARMIEETIVEMQKKIALEEHEKKMRMLKEREERLEKERSTKLPTAIEERISKFKASNGFFWSDVDFDDGHITPVLQPDVVEGQKTGDQIELDDVEDQDENVEE